MLEIASTFFFSIRVILSNAKNPNTFTYTLQILHYVQNDTND